MGGCESKLFGAHDGGLRMDTPCHHISIIFFEILAGKHGISWDIIGSEAWEPPYFTFFVSEEQLRGAPPWSHTGETGNQRPSTCRTKIGLDWSASSAFFSPVFRWFCYGSIHKSWFFYGFSMVFLGSQRIRHLGPSSGIIPKGTWRCCWSKPWGMSQWSSWGLFEKSLAAWKKRCSRSYIVYVCICGFHCFCSC